MCSRIEFNLRLHVVHAMQFKIPNAMNKSSVRHKHDAKLQASNQMPQPLLHTRNRRWTTTNTKNSTTNTTNSTFNQHQTPIVIQTLCARNRNENGKKTTKTHWIGTCIDFSELLSFLLPLFELYAWILAWILSLCVNLWLLNDCWCVNSCVRFVECVLLIDCCSVFLLRDAFLIMRFCYVVKEWRIVFYAWFFHPSCSEKISEWWKNGRMKKIWIWWKKSGSPMIRDDVEFIELNIMFEIHMKLNLKYNFRLEMK